MSLNAAALEVLVTKGLSAADILEVARALETRRDATAAERQQRRRDKVKAEAEAAAPKQPRASRRDVTRDAPPNDIYSNPPPLPLVISDEITVPASISAEPTSKPAQPAETPLSPEEVLEAWNDMAGRHGLPKAKLTPARRKTLGSRIRQHSIEDFTEAIRAVPRSPFLLGENQRGWRADFDFFLQPTSFIKLIEGSYDRATH